LAAEVIPAGWAVFEESAVASALPAAEFKFADSAAQATAVTQGVAAANLAVAISAVAKPNWSWDEASGAYLRSEGQTPAQSASGVRLSAQNVVVLSVEVHNAGGTDAAGSPIPETMIVGSGTGLVDRRV
jgi:hypothetical protein